MNSEQNKMIHGSSDELFNSCNLMSTFVFAFACHLSASSLWVILLDTSCSFGCKQIERKLDYKSKNQGGPGKTENCNSFELV